MTTPIYGLPPGVDAQQFQQKNNADFPYRVFSSKSFLYCISKIRPRGKRWTDLREGDLQISDKAASAAELFLLVRTDYHTSLTSKNQPPPSEVKFMTAC
jgi:hypothetical protein